ncbi:MAG: hypothetical protein ACOH1P_11285 [Lysobacter sp.]
MNSNLIMVTTLTAAACLLPACSQQPTPVDAAAAAPTTAAATSVGPQYTARLQPMNSQVTGSDAMADARFVVDGDSLLIRIDARGLPPDIEHWQHFHGFADDKVAACPTAAADANGDGIVDLIETEAVAGTTMVPFDTDPAAMDIAHGQYPHAGADGSFNYQQIVSMPALTAAFAKAFAGQTPDLDRRVIFIHGVVTDARLPSTVASLGPIPAHVTLPIACGVIERVRQ